MTSIRLTVFLFLILAAVAVIGTVVPQDQPPGWYLRRYGEGLGDLISGGGLARIYYSPWFLGAMGLLALNICACLVQGLPRALRRCLTPFSPEAALALPERGKFSWSAGADPRPRIEALLREELGGHCRKETLPDKEIFWWSAAACGPWGLIWCTWPCC